MKYDLFIIIPVHNCLEYTKGCIASIKSNTPYKIIIINNNSTDGTDKYINEMVYRQKIAGFNLSDNLGVAGSWNFGIRTGLEHFKSDFFLIINNDVLLHPEMIDKLIEKIKDRQTLLVSATDISGRISSASEISGFLAPSEEVQVEAPEFSSFLIKKETIEKVGYFDEQFYPAYFEDNDYHFRIRKAGYKAWKINTAVYFHYGSRTIKENENIKMISDRGYLGNKEYYKRKWGGYPGEEKYQTPFNNKDYR